MTLQYKKKRGHSTYILSVIPYPFDPELVGQGCAVIFELFDISGNILLDYQITHLQQQTDTKIATFFLKKRLAYILITTYHLHCMVI